MEFGSLRGMASVAFALRGSRPLLPLRLRAATDLSRDAREGGA